MGANDEKAILNMRNKFSYVTKWLTEMDNLISNEIKRRGLEDALKKE